MGTLLLALLVLVIVGVIWLQALRSSSRAPSSAGAPASPRLPASSSRDELSKKQRIFDGNEGWLRERWRMADAEETSGSLQHFPKWYFDDATDRQRDRLTRDGVSVSRGGTKGQISDVIGLFEEPDAEDLERLKFFGVKLDGPMKNQTRARYEVAKLDADPEKRRAWLMRPASAMQKEFYRFIGEKVPAGLTNEQAEASISEKLDGLTEAQQDEWTTFENLIEEFEDRELRSDLEIRKPSPGDIRAAMVALKGDGKDVEDTYEIAQKLLQMKPGLARGR